VSKAAILTHIEEIGGKEMSSRYGGSKKHDLATSAEKIFGGSVPIEAELREAALAWVPDVMRFSTPATALELAPAKDESVTDSGDELQQAA
jgi:ParB family chromosome partitioning protein